MRQEYTLNWPPVPHRVLYTQTFALRGNLQWPTGMFLERNQENPRGSPHRHENMQNSTHSRQSGPGTER